MRIINQLIRYMVIPLVLFNGCHPKSLYPEYSRNKNGIHYKLIQIGDNGIKAKPNDYITVTLTYRTLRDSLFFTGKRKFQITEPEFKGSIDECFIMMAEGDSASFIISADNFFINTLGSSLPTFIPANSNMKIDIMVNEIQTLNEYNKQKEAFLSWIEDFGEYEKILLKQYIEEEKLDIEPSKTGLYTINIKKGEGRKVAKGDTIIVHYEGRFLNGKFFDSTVKRKEPFQFVYGQEWQVIQGLEEAIGTMTEGEKSLFILPSDIAFGKEGSSTGIIPPFTSLIFEVELLEVRSGE